MKIKQSKRCGISGERRAKLADDQEGEGTMMRKTILTCAVFTWTCASTVAFAQETPFAGEKPSAKHANVHRFHHAAHASLHGAHHHKAMAAGHASIKSHPSHGQPPMTRHAKKVHPQ
jgi:hypothetical protein